MSEPNHIEFYPIQQTLLPKHMNTDIPTMMPSPKIPMPFSENELRMFLADHLMEGENRLRIWCGEMYCHVASTLEHTSDTSTVHNVNVVAGWGITLGRSERVGNRRWKSKRYNVIRCLYKLFEEESFTNKFWAEWEMFNTPAQYRRMLRKHKHHLYMNIPESEEDHLTVLDMENQTYFSTLPLVLEHNPVENTASTEITDTQTIQHDQVTTPFMNDQLEEEICEMEAWFAHMGFFS